MKAEQLKNERLIKNKDLVPVEKEANDIDALHSKVSEIKTNLSVWRAV